MKHCRAAPPAGLAGAADMGVCSSRLTKCSWYQHFRSSSVLNNDCVSGVVPQPERVCQARVAAPARGGPGTGLIWHTSDTGAPRGDRAGLKVRVAGQMIAELATRVQGVGEVPIQCAGLQWHVSHIGARRQGAALAQGCMWLTRGRGAAKPSAGRFHVPLHVGYWL